MSLDAKGLVMVGVAAFFGGAVNSVAGGGSLITFPVAIAAGLPPVAANATNTLAMTPGGVAAAFAYRRELGPRTRLALALALPAALGGAVGAAVLLAAPAKVFELLVPWLVAAATGLIVLQQRISPKTGRAPAKRSAWTVGALIALISIYGGYFGAGIGIVMLALLALLGKASIHQLNAMKSVIIAAVNAAASVYFLALHAPDLGAGAVMALGAILGGFAGAASARRFPAERVRWLVVAIGVCLSVLLAVRYWA